MMLPPNLADNELAVWVHTCRIWPGRMRWPVIRTSRVSVGHQAVDAVTAAHSPRSHDKLRRLHAALAPLHTSPGVAELRDRLTTTAT